MQEAIWVELSLLQELLCTFFSVIYSLCIRRRLWGFQLRTVNGATLLFQKFFVNSVVCHCNVDRWGQIHCLLSQNSASIFSHYWRRVNYMGATQLSLLCKLSIFRIVCKKDGTLAYCLKVHSFIRSMTRSNFDHRSITVPTSIDWPSYELSILFDIKRYHFPFIWLTQGRSSILLLLRRWPTCLCTIIFKIQLVWRVFPFATKRLKHLHVLIHSPLNGILLKHLVQVVLSVLMALYDWVVHLLGLLPLRYAPTFLLRIDTIPI